MEGDDQPDRRRRQSEGRHVQPPRDLPLPDHAERVVDELSRHEDAADEEDQVGAKGDHARTSIRDASRL